MPNTMKSKIFYLSLVILLSISCHENSFDLDDIMTQCYESKYLEEGHDIKAIIEDYEKLLVKEGVLKDDSGKSYLEVFQKIASDKDFIISCPTFQEYDPGLKLKRETAIAIFNCESEMLELVKNKNPKWHRMLTLFESQEVKENPELIYQAMVDGLSENDLNAYYFKLKMFHLFDMVNSKWGKQSYF